MKRLGIPGLEPILQICIFLGQDTLFSCTVHLCHFEMAVFPSECQYCYLSEKSNLSLRIFKPLPLRGFPNICNQTLE